MGKSSEKTVRESQRKSMIKRNSLIKEKMKKMKDYIASINELSPIVSRVVNRRRREIMKRQYSAMTKSNTRAI